MKIGKQILLSIFLFFVIVLLSFTCLASTYPSEEKNSTNINWAISNAQGQVIAQKISPGVSDLNQSCDIAGFNISVGYNPSPTGSPLYVSWRICPSGNCANPVTISEWDSNIESLLTNSIKEYNVTPPGNLSMNKNEIYLLGVRSSNAGGNYIWVAGDSSAPLYDGTNFRDWQDSGNTGTFTQDSSANTDMAFKVFCKQAVVTPGITINSNLLNETITNQNNFTITFNASFSGGAENYLYHCEALNFSDSLAFGEHLNLSVTQSFIIDTTNEEEVFNNINLDCHYHPTLSFPTTLNIRRGVFLAGNLSNLTAIDGQSLAIGESAGQIGLNFTMNITNVTTFNAIHIQASRNDITHNVSVYLTNFSNNKDYHIFDLIDGSVMHSYTFSPINPNDYINNSRIHIRFLDIANGNPSDNISLDYVTAVTESIEANKTGYKYTIDNIPPRENDSIVNNTDFALNANLNLISTFTDFNFTFYNISILDSNSLLWNGQNLIVGGLATTTTTANLNPSLTQIGAYSILINSRDWLNNTHTNRIYFSVNNTSPDTAILLSIEEGVKMIGVYIFFTALFVVCIIGIIFGKLVTRFMSGSFLGLLMEIFANFITTDNFIADVNTFNSFKYALQFGGIAVIIIFVVFLVIEFMWGNNEKKEKPKNPYDIYNNL